MEDIVGNTGCGFSVSFLLHCHLLNIYLYGFRCVSPNSNVLGHKRTRCNQMVANYLFY